MAKQTIETTWEAYQYDTWGNARNGFEVNSVYAVGIVGLVADVVVANVEHTTATQFAYADIPDHRIRKAIKGRRVRFDWIDDMWIEIEDSRNGKPIGRLQCVSHESLSPIRRKPESVEKNS